MSKKLNLKQVCGQDETFLCELAGTHRLHPLAAAALQRLQERARNAGFDLQPVSCFRSFDRQLTIWNRKAKGERPVLDSQGRELKREETDDWGWVQAILRWSALPGASRHHWGCDLDVYDAAAVVNGYQVQLTPEEVEPGGPFAAMHDWLDQQIATAQSEGFYRPYSRDTGGVAPERWHLSYAPVARECESQLNESALYSLLAECKDFALWPVVADHWQEVYQRFVLPPLPAIEEPALKLQQRETD